MDPLTIIATFGPMIANLIPQISKIFVRPEDKKTQGYIDAANLVLDVFTKAGLKDPTASGQNVAQVAQAVEAVTKDAGLRQDVAKAVITDPPVMAFLEVGGGFAGAREADIKQQAAPAPFWKTSAVFWISMLMLPMVYWFVGSSIVGGVSIPDTAPWYVQVLKLFGTAWSLDARSGIANLVIGLVLGGICGVYYGISVTQQKANATEAK